MKKIAKLLAIAIPTLLLATQAHGFCFDPSKLYVAGGGSIDFRRDNIYTSHSNITYSGSGELAPYLEKVEFDAGWNSSLAIGYNFCNLRTELEWTYRKSKIDTIVVSTQDQDYIEKGVAGSARDSALMANLIQDIPLCSKLGLYVGGGLGVSFAKYEVGPFNANGSVAGELSSTKEDIFAWQLMAGFYIPLVDCIEITVGYRFFATNGPREIQRHLPGSTPDVMTMSFQKAFMTNSLEFGTRVHF